jgi:hypothetical protein
VATITYDSDAPGQAARRPAQVLSGSVEIFATGRFSFDNSYPTGGEDISAIFALFPRACKGVLMENPLSSAGTGKFVVIDYTNKKAKLLTSALAEVANASDQSGAANLRWVAWGI